MEVVRSLVRLRGVTFKKTTQFAAIPSRTLSLFTILEGMNRLFLDAQTPELNILISIKKVGQGHRYLILL